MEVETVRPTFFVPMTGRAEDARRVLPDAANPRIDNGDFEEAAAATGEPALWYYQRQVELASGADAPSGERYARFANSDPGRASQALQAFGVDGRKVRQLRLSFYVAGEQIFPGESLWPAPMFHVTFYDQAREVAGEQVVGRWQGTFAWRKQTVTLAVPPDAREAVMAIGLFGAVGKLSFDRIELSALPP
ncbi:MAG: hypothetical protein GXY83_33635 [Rhodopirellula sp.]|nr:hypothetical protein [Rhodopirellula sp.]